MPVINDPEFGRITVRRSASASQVRIRVAPDGRLRASLPMYAPLFLVKRLIKNARDDLRAMLAESKPRVDYRDGMQIGKSHTLVIQSRSATQATGEISGTQILIDKPADLDLSSDEVQQLIRELTLKALRREAKSYLPRRLKYLANQHGYSYSAVRFSHASSRWGSCSSTGTISLNIALMQLPFELIDYVLVHELAHTHEMNHSAKFWELVETADPDYKAHRQSLKEFSTSI